ncbi:MAG: hypothetical protein HYU66_14375 [Armatimonadetes bacterium]|nr:hypothetical protein [Armatimonadota bacterium]
MRGRLMLGWAVCWLLAVGATGVEDPLAFVREGRVYLIETSGEARPVIAADPGWEYALPTWVGHDQLLVMRLKGGVPGHSAVGLFELGQRPAKPSGIGWIAPWAGAWCIGYDPVRDNLLYLKIRAGAGERFDLYLGGGPPGGDPGSSERVSTYYAGEPWQPEKRLHTSPDGRFVMLPEYPTDVANMTAEYETGVRHFVNRYYLDPDWLNHEVRGLTLNVAAWGPDQRLALGGLTHGLYLLDLATRRVRPVHVFPKHDACIKEVSFSRDGERVYYEVQSWSSPDAKPAIWVCTTAPGGEPRKLLDRAAAPAVRP